MRVSYLGNANVDFTFIARAYGIEGEKVRGPAQLDAAIQRAIRAERNGRPFLPGRGDRPNRVGCPVDLVPGLLCDAAANVAGLNRSGGPMGRGAADVVVQEGARAGARPSRPSSSQKLNWTITFANRALRMASGDCHSSNASFTSSTGAELNTL